MVVRFAPENSYTYDALDRRISKTVDSNPGLGVPAITTHYIYDRADVRMEFTSIDGVTSPILAVRYMNGPGIDNVLAEEQYAAGVGTMLWHLTNNINSTTNLLDVNGDLQNHIVYAAFGSVLSQSNSAISTTRTYTGREFDQELGDYFYRSRHYDSASGRFLGEDPLRFAAGMNLYSYVDDSPTMFNDPFGLSKAGDALAKAASNLAKAKANLFNNRPGYYTCTIFVDASLRASGAPLPYPKKVHPTLVKDLEKHLKQSPNYISVPYNDQYHAELGDIVLFKSHSGIVTSVGGPDGPVVTYGGSTQTGNVGETELSILVKVPAYAGIPTGIYRAK